MPKPATPAAEDLPLQRRPVHVLLAELLEPQHVRVDARRERRPRRPARRATPTSSSDRDRGVRQSETARADTRLVSVRPRSGAARERRPPLGRMRGRAQEALDREAVAVRPCQHGRLERGLGPDHVDQPDTRSRVPLGDRGGQERGAAAGRDGQQDGLDARLGRLDEHRRQARRRGTATTTASCSAGLLSRGSITSRSGSSRSSVSSGSNRLRARGRDRGDQRLVAQRGRRAAPSRERGGRR